MITDAVQNRRTFQFLRVENPADIPPPDERVVEVVLLDMNHRWPNLGHDSMVDCVRESSSGLDGFLRKARISIRVLSFDVRRSLMIPETQGGRYGMFLGTGGPGQIDPRSNDGCSEGSQGLEEDASWESPLFSLFDTIRDDSEKALLAVCHTFGVLCRWSGVAAPVLRGAERGGKSSGVRENALTPEGARHPWFARFSRRLADGTHHKILDNRLFDLIPTASPFPTGVIPVAFEQQPARSDGEAITMLEFARDSAGTMPRVFAVNHHPEIFGRQRQRELLEMKRTRGEVTAAWYEERSHVLDEASANEETERMIRLTAEYTLRAPLRFHLHRLVRRRADSLGVRTRFHENEVLDFAFD